MMAQCIISCTLTRESGRSSFSFTSELISTGDMRLWQHQVPRFLPHRGLDSPGEIMFHSFASPFLIAWRDGEEGLHPRMCGSGISRYHILRTSMAYLKSIYRRGALIAS